MKKKVLIWTAVFILVVIAMLVYAHFVPVWVSFGNVMGFSVGIILGWVAHILYVKYVLNDNCENHE